MNRNFRTLVKAREFNRRGYAALEERVNFLESLDYSEVINEKISNSGFVLWEDLDDAIDQAIVDSEVVQSGDLDAFREDLENDFVSRSDVEDLLDSALGGYSDIDDWAGSSDVVFNWSLEDRLDDFSSIIKDKVEDVLADHDFTEAVDDVVNTYDFDLVLEDTHYPTQVRDLDLRVRMLEVLAGLESVKG